MNDNNGMLQRFLDALKCLKGKRRNEAAGDTAALRSELAERNEEIAKLRKEYLLQREQSREQAERAATEAIEGIMRQFAAPLANLGAMHARHREQGDLNPSDIFQAVASFENILVEKGLQQIGMVGEEPPYDPALHQILDGTRPFSGDPVRIRFAGFRFNGKLIVKARAGTAGHHV